MLNLLYPERKIEYHIAPSNLMNYEFEFTKKKMDFVVERMFAYYCFMR